MLTIPSSLSGAGRSNEGSIAWAPYGLSTTAFQLLVGLLCRIGRRSRVVTRVVTRVMIRVAVL
eukprot:COSAG01_NODE_1666_length_9571_cov_4.915963_7_plen_63_part_00